MKISVIIPALNEEHYISNTLSCLTSLTGDFEIIVVDGGSTDATIKIASDFFGVIVLTSEKGRANQMNYGASRAKGEILLFLHADTIVPSTAYTVIKDHFEDPAIVGGSFFLKFKKKNLGLRFYSWCSQLSLEFFTYGDHGIFMRKCVFDSIGGYMPMNFLEDVEIQKRLRRAGKFKKLNAAVTTSSRRLEKTGIINQFIIDVLIVAAYKLGVRPQKLKIFYKDHFGK